MSSDRIPMTRTGYNKIKATLEEMNTVEMPVILERLKLARAEGEDPVHAFRRHLGDRVGPRDVLVRRGSAAE